MPKYLLTFQVRLHSERQGNTVEQSEEVIVHCEPNELIHAINTERSALQVRVRAAVARIDPAGSSSVILKRSECLPNGRESA